MLHFWLLIPQLSKRGRSPRSTKTRPRTLQNAALLARPATRQNKAAVCLAGCSTDGKKLKKLYLLTAEEWKKEWKKWNGACPNQVQLAPAQNPCVQTSRRKPFQRAKRIGASKVYRARSFDFFVKEQDKGTRSQICEDGGTKRHLGGPMIWPPEIHLACNFVIRKTPTITIQD